MGRANCLGQLGSVAYARFHAAQEANLSDECFIALQEAARYYEQALGMFPVNAVYPLAVAHNMLGNIYDDAHRLDAALDHYRRAVRYQEAMQDRFGSGQTRYNVAVTLLQAGRFADAREWARAALRDYESCANADQQVIDSAKLLERIESHLPKT
jgi:tetratricopeptide (TPR) repeat protein